MTFDAIVIEDKKGRLRVRLENGAQLAFLESDCEEPVFPGDTPYRQRWAATIGGDCPVNVSAIELSPHVGAHADAPLHYDPSGAAIGTLDLAPYLGRCRVVHAIGCGPLIEWRR